MCIPNFLSNPSDFTKETNLLFTPLQTVPFRFLKRHFRTDNTNTTLSVSDGRAWSIKYIMGARSAHFSAGWRKFAEDNSLEVGDVCAFELVKCTETSLKVVIFRKKEDGNGRLQH